MLTYINYICFSVPIWINVKITSKYPCEKHKKEREQWFGGNFELCGFKNGAPYYSDVNKQHIIHYHKNKAWNLSKTISFENDNGRFFYRIDTSGLLSLQK